MSCRLVSFLQPLYCYVLCSSEQAVLPPLPMQQDKISTSCTSSLQPLDHQPCRLGCQRIYLASMSSLGNRER